MVWQRRMPALTGLWRRVGVVLALAAFLAPVARAQLTIEITRGVERPVPIAVVPFGWSGTGQAPFDIAGLVGRDLANSGRFAPMATKDMVARPTDPTVVNFSDWRTAAVDALLIGTLTRVAPDQYRIDFQLFDVLRARQLLGFRLTTDLKGLRKASHRISDMVFEKLTGIPGVFSTQIAYVSQDQGAQGAPVYRLIVADEDGANPHVITQSSQPLMSPTWSPDGRRLAYVSFEQHRAAIYIQTLRTGNRVLVSARAGVNGAPAFSPDGRKLALTLSDGAGNLDIYTMDLATRALTRLTHSPAIDTGPAWSPDGRELYFTSDRAGGPQVYRVAARAGAGSPERITYDGSYNARPRVSPDGKEIAVVHRTLNNGDCIALVNLDTGTTRVLSDGRLDEAPDFAPNGAQVIYATRYKDRGVLEWVSTDGRIQRAIYSGKGDVRDPAWSPFPRP